VFLACTEPTPTSPAKHAVASPVTLTNPLHGPGTWSYVVTQIHGSHYWFLLVRYSGDPTIHVIDVAEGSSGNLISLDAGATATVDAGWCLHPRSQQDHNLCEAAAEFDDTIAVNNDWVGWIEEPPYYEGPGDDFGVRFTLPTSAATLKLAVDKSEVLIGQTAHFTATLSDGSTPHVIGWRFDSVAVASCGAQTSCDFAVPNSGAMTVTATVAGSTQTARVNVTATCQAFKDSSKVTDSLLKVPYVQHILDSLGRATHWDSALTNQVEVGGFFALDSNKALTFIPYSPFGGFPRGPCLSGPDSAQIPDLGKAGYTILAQVHSHPNHAEAERNVTNCWTIDASGNLAHMQPEKDGRLHIKYGPSTFDTYQWYLPKNAPTFDGYLLQPDAVYTWRRGPKGFSGPKKYALNSCLGGNR
jgi:hypothetical protein